MAHTTIRVSGHPADMDKLRAYFTLHLVGAVNLGSDEEGNFVRLSGIGREDVQKLLPIQGSIIELGFTILSVSYE